MDRALALALIPIAAGLALPVAWAPSVALAQESKAPAAETKPPARARRKKGRQKVEIPADAAIATMPGFRMLEDGRSRVFVKLSRPREPAQKAVEGRLVFTFPGTWVTSRTNRFPLLTAFFPTPVASARLVAREGEVDLVIDLRQAVEATHRVIEFGQGVVLQVDFPRLDPPPGGR